MTTDEQALHDIVRQIETSWNASDGAGYASVFADNAAFIHIYGGQMDGRPAIETAHNLIFDTIYKGSRNQIEVKEVRFLRPDVAVIWTEAHLDYFDNGEARHLDARPTMVAVKDDGTWKVAALQNTRIAELPGVIREKGPYK